MLEHVNFSNSVGKPNSYLNEQLTSPPHLETFYPSLPVCKGEKVGGTDPSTLLIIPLLLFTPPPFLKCAIPPEKLTI